MDLTIGPVLTWTTEQMLNHVENVLHVVPGAKVEFGGRALQGHQIPKVYGAIEPTAIRLSIDALMSSEEAFRLATTEVFGPIQILVDYRDDQLPMVLKAMEKLKHHLTAAVVSSNPSFVHKVLSNSVNGTTVRIYFMSNNLFRSEYINAPYPPAPRLPLKYAGIRARTTGAPTNHWFGPAGDPRGAGIGSPEAVLSVWTCHREIVRDQLPVDENWKLPEAT